MEDASIAAKTTTGTAAGTDTGGTGAIDRTLGTNLGGKNP